MTSSEWFGSESSGPLSNSFKTGKQWKSASWAFLEKREGNQPKDLHRTRRGAPCSRRDPRPLGEEGTWLRWFRPKNAAE